MNQAEKLHYAVSVLRSIADKSLTYEECVTEAETAVKMIVQRKPRAYLSQPTLGDVAAYIEQRKSEGAVISFTAEQWMNHYEANGWMVGRNKMKDWKAAVRTWEKQAPKIAAQKSATSWRKLSESDCVSVDRFDEWFMQQEAIPRTEANRIKVHACRVAGATFEDRFTQTKKMVVGVARNNTFSPGVNYEEIASRQLRESGLL